MKNAPFLAALSILMLQAAPAAAEDIKVVVELFTSQGCSSCPPADKVLEKLAVEGDVLALGHHVNYWDYLGWRDTLATQKSTDRQYRYAETLRRKNVYTPQAVVNGQDHIVGSDETGVRKLIKSLAPAESEMRAPVSVTRDDHGLSVTIGSGEGSGDVIAIYFQPSVTVDIGRGENAGRQVHYVNSVSDMQTIGMWDGSEKTFTLPGSVLANGLECAILVQKIGSNGEPGAIQGAARCPGASS